MTKPEYEAYMAHAWTRYEPVTFEELLQMLEDAKREKAHRDHERERERERQKKRNEPLVILEDDKNGDGEKMLPLVTPSDSQAA